MQLSHKNLVKDLFRFFTENKMTLSVAESCTGGLIADMITDVPGVSAFFDSGIVSYSNEAKMRLLGIKNLTLFKYGAVSAEAAREMAEGMRRASRTGISLSVTGNLGPVPMEGKETGLVYFAVSSSAGTVTREMRFSGSRIQIKKQAALEGLKFLLETVNSLP